jgi:quercetin dioxygenase-like cupin family protein
VAGRAYEFPDGSIYQVIVSGESTGGAHTEVDVTLPPGAVTPPPHIHRRQQETLSVLDGTVEALVGRQWRALRSGDSVAIAAGIAHTFRNRSDGIVRLVMAHAPARSFERYLERLYWLTAMNRIQRGRTMTSVLYGSLLLDMHRDDLVLAGAAARARVGVMARAARLLRLRIDRASLGAPHRG